MENNKLEERLNRLEHKMDVMFNEIINIKTHLNKENIRERIEKTKLEKEKYEDELNYLNMNLDNIWQENERLQKEYRYEYYGDREVVDIRS